MGPGDPFGQSSRQSAPSEDDGFTEVRSGDGPFGRKRAAGEVSGGLVAALGLLIGLVFGTLTLVTSATGAVLVLACGAVGALAAWGAHGTATGSLDVGGAWRALRRRE